MNAVCSNLLENCERSHSQGWLYLGWISSCFFISIVTLWNTLSQTPHHLLILCFPAVKLFTSLNYCLVQSLFNILATQKLFFFEKDHTIWKFQSSNAWLTKTETKEKEIFCSLGLEWVQLQHSEVWIAVVVVVPYLALALIDFKDFLSGTDFYFADFSSFAFLWHLCKPLKTVVHYCKPLHIFAHFCKHTFALIRIPWCRVFGYSCLTSFFLVSKSESKKKWAPST